MKIPSVFLIKKVVAEAKCLVVNSFINDLANIVGLTFFQDAKNQINYKDSALAYYYYLLLIFYSFNQIKLDIFFSINLLSFYNQCNKYGKNALKDAFKSVYHYVKYELIANLTAKAMRWLKIFAKNNYLTSIIMFVKFV